MMFFMPSILSALTPSEHRSPELQNLMAQLAGLAYVLAVPIALWGLVILLICLFPSSRRRTSVELKASELRKTIPPELREDLKTWPEYERLEALDEQLADIERQLEAAKASRAVTARLRSGYELLAIQRRLDAIAPELQLEIKARQLARKELKDIYG
jgi:hypothetical protein